MEQVNREVGEKDRYCRLWAQGQKVENNER